MLLHDILCGMPENRGVFTVNKKAAGVLIDLFCIVVSKMSLNILNNLEMRLYFALLIEFVNEKSSNRAIYFLSYFLNWVFFFDQQLFDDSCVNILRKINLDFYRSFQRQGLIILDQKYNKQPLFQEMDMKVQQELKIDLSENEEDNDQNKNQSELDKQLAKIEDDTKKSKALNIVNFATFYKLYKILNIYLEQTIDQYILNTQHSILQNEIRFSFALIRNYPYFMSLYQSFQNNETNFIFSEAYRVLMYHIKQDAETVDYTKEIRAIINNEDNIKLFYKILMSPSVRAYYSSTTDELNEEIKECYNKIPNIKDYTMEELKQMINETIIIIHLDETTKGITTGYLRVAINSIWIKVFWNNKTEFDDLLKAYVFITLFHESNHYIKRHFRTTSNSDDVKTPRGEGGKLLIKHFFGSEQVIDLDIDEAQEILKLENWNEVSILKSIIKDKPTGENSNKNRGSHIQYMRKTKKDEWNCVLR